MSSRTASPAFAFPRASSCGLARSCPGPEGQLRARARCRRRCSFCLEATAPLRMAALRIALSLTSLAALSERLKLSLVRPELPPRMPMQRRWPRPRTGGSASRALQGGGPSSLLSARSREEARLPCCRRKPGVLRRPSRRWAHLLAARLEISEERDATSGMARFLLLPQHGYSPARRRGLEHG